jgi:hypothetical protein
MLCPYTLFRGTRNHLLEEHLGAVIVAAQQAKHGKIVECHRPFSKRQRGCRMQAVYSRLVVFLRGLKQAGLIFQRG